MDYDLSLINIQCNITSDSRKVKEGSIFFLLVDNEKYFLDAISKKASVICIDENFNIGNKKINTNTNIIKLPNIKLAYSFYQSKKFCKKPNNIIGITGTNGKTSVVNICRNIFSLAKYKCASLGTLGIFINEDKISDSIYTTPVTEDIYKIFSSMSDKCVEYLFMEISSHSLDQYRCHHAKINVAVITNITRDHLDYHLDMDSYFKSKIKIFTDLLVEDGYAVVNADMDYYKQVVSNIPKGIKIIDYGYNAKHFKLLKNNTKGLKQEIIYIKDGNKITLTIPLLGKFQGYNILCAIAIAECLNKNITDCISDIQPIEGRMQLISYKGSNIVIDFAHTPDALLHAIESVKWHFIDKKILCILGCGGNRDIEKRFEMGKICSKYCDYTIITDDNPRNEDPELIRKDIISGFGNDNNFIEIGDRKNAIEYAVNKYHKDYTILIVGKGHEKYQILNNEKKYFNDFLCASKFLYKI